MSSTKGGEKKPKIPEGELTLSEKRKGGDLNL